MKIKKILFIEDDPDQILIYQSKFELEGLFMITATEGRRGVDLARREKPDLILLDLLLRNEDGLDVLAKLKESPKTKEIPVIVFTNFDTEEARQRALELGAIDYIVKAQFTPTEIVNKIKKILEKNV
jgi:DNA-binding response OmpR family regulator